MPHELDRVLAACAGSIWAVEPQKAMEIANMIVLRHHGQARDWADERPQRAEVSRPYDLPDGKRVHVLTLSGSIVPRAGLMSDMSGAVSLDRFSVAFRQAAADDTASAIVLDVDSPGGVVSGVPEAAKMIFGARRIDRPIIAVANYCAASAAYWLASAADEIVMSPSAQVGSIGVVNMHDDLTAALEEAGVNRTVVYEGPRKVELYPWAPLSTEAQTHLKSSVAQTYEQFVGDVAKHRGVAKAVVRADPEKTDRHMGGGRMYKSKQAIALGLADRVATMDEVLTSVAKPRRKTSSVAMRGRGLALI